MHSHAAGGADARSPARRCRCDLNFDPFKRMREREKKYAFTIMLHEIVETVPTLWNATMQHALEIGSFGHLPTLIDPATGSWSTCHYWCGAAREMPGRASTA